MGSLLFASVFIKVIAAIIEIFAQMLLTNTYGVEKYGDYSFYINIIEILYWILFSGMVKCNTFYLSDKSCSIRKFKQKYLRLYFAPVLLVLFVCCVFLAFKTGQWAYIMCPFALMLYFFAYDASSSALARGNGYRFLIGEYLVGRCFLLVAFIVLGFVSSQVNVAYMVLVYALQYAAVILWLHEPKGAVNEKRLREEKVSIAKLWQYQQSDIASGVISQSPVILQYLFVGSYETGIVSIVVVVKKLVNFISGPTAKIFLPEFSRLYKQGKIDEICSFYKLIIQVQMLFVSLVGLGLMGFTELVLQLFSPELVVYSGLFRFVAAGFLLVASLGPGAGLMQMTGQEKLENRMRWGTIVLMLVIWFVMRKDPFFALYGLCAQALAEGLIKYALVCKWFHKAPISTKEYILLWTPSILISIFIRKLNLSTNWAAVFVAGALCFSLTLCMIFTNTTVREKARAYLYKHSNTKGI